MYVGLLGPLEVRDSDGAVIDVAGARLRTVLTRLALDAGRPVGVDALADAVWADETPADVANALQTLVSRLRRAFGGGATIAQSPAGYVLNISPNDVDVNRFEALARSGSEALREGDAERASSQLREALALWRGPALVDGGVAVSTWQSRLEDLRLAVVVDRYAADLQLGRATQVVVELEALVSEYPLHEQLATLLVTALAASGRQAEALRAYERVRCQLADELGVDPAQPLQDAHLAVLRGEVAVSTPVGSPRRTNLKSQLTSFVGRDAEVARVAAALDAARLVTVLGPGGAGKTRLAAEAASGCVTATADGVWLVELAPVLDPAEVPHTVLAALGRRDPTLMDQRLSRAPREALEQLVEALTSREALIVLDNCEHLLDSAASLADDLLAQCPRLRILATSREPLGIVGETLVLLPPLGTPAPDDLPETASAYPAVRLFADRAVAVSPEFVVDADTVAPVIEIVRRLDGQPLAIELAAARLRSMPVGEIAVRLSDRFRLLVGSRTAMPRHRTLRAVVEWSWDLLSPSERLLTERLAVFPAGVTATSARAVCADSAVPATDIPDLLAALVDRSLLQLLGSETPRYRMLETIREFGTERLAERGELEDMRASFAEYFAAFAERELPKLRGPHQLETMRLAEIEHDNLLAALRHLCDSGRSDRAHELASALNGYWALSGRHGEATTWLAAVLATAAPSDVALRLEIETAQVANSMAAITHASADGEYPLSKVADLAGKLVELDSFDRPMLAILAPIVLFFGERYPDAAEALAATAEHPDPWVRATTAAFKARFAENEGDLDEVRRSVALAEELYNSVGDRWGLGSILPLSAMLDVYESRLEEAKLKLERALTLFEELNGSDADDHLYIELRLSDVLFRLGDLEGGRQHIERAGDLAKRSGAPEWLAITSALRGAAAATLGDLVLARHLLDDAEEILAGPIERHLTMAHGLALVGAVGAGLDLQLGELDRARDRLKTAWPEAVRSKDKPIISVVAVSLAGAVSASGRHADAAEVLGLAARLRGAEDPTSPTIAAVMSDVVAEIGAEQYEKRWAEAYANGGETAISRLAAILDDL